MAHHKGGGLQETAKILTRSIWAWSLRRRKSKTR